MQRLMKISAVNISLAGMQKWSEITMGNSFSHGNMTGKCYGRKHLFPKVKYFSFAM